MTNDGQGEFRDDPLLAFVTFSAAVAAVGG